MADVSIIGGSGYAGGELVRLLLGHPATTIRQVTSERNAGKFVRTVHPNLRKRTDLKFTSAEGLEPVDVLFIALPHGVSMGMMADLRKKAGVIIDLSADFRLRNAADYPKWYGHEHTAPEMLDEFVYGIPELHREEIRTANLVSSAGCMATTTMTGGSSASTAVAIASCHSVSASCVVIILRMPMTMVCIESRVVISSGHRYWFQP